MHLLNEHRMNPENVFEAARRMTADLRELRELRVMRAERTERGWKLKYISLDDTYPIAALERSLTRAVGERVDMVNLHYDFDTAARLLYAS